MRHKTWVVTSSALYLLAASSAHAYDGCTPYSAAADKCQGAVAKAFSKLIGSVMKCHVKQADAVTRGTPFDEEACEQTDPSRSAAARFGNAITKLAATCAPALITSANDLEAALLSGPASLDAQNGAVYCDSTFGVHLDPLGDDAGWKPNSTANLKCADGVARNLSKLVKDLLTCHRKKADSDFKARFFDVVACESKGTSKYDGRSSALTGAGICPGCLDATTQGALRDSVVTQLNVADPSIFICPSTTTSTSVTTTSSTSSTSTSATSSTSSSTSPSSSSSTSSSSSSTSSTHTTTTSSTSSSSSSSTTSSTSSSSTSSTCSSSSSSSSTTSSTSSTVTTTTIAFTQYALTLTTSTAGTSFCGSAGFGTPATPPFAGEVDDGAAVKIADLGKGCLYFGGGSATGYPGAPLPSTSSTILDITSPTTLGPHVGASTSCTKGVLATNHCGRNPGTSCSTPNGQSTCPSGDTCVADAQCFFGPPLSVPDVAAPALSTCLIDAMASDASGAPFNPGTGSAAIFLRLSTRLYVTGTAYDDPATPSVIEGCPRCVASHCNGGQNSGAACTGVGPGLTTLQCPPTNAQFQAVLPINLSLTTGTASSTVANGRFCPGQLAAPHAGAFGEPTARTIKEVGAPSGNLNDGLPHGTTFASVFCVPMTGNVFLDGAFDLPGPGAISVAADVKLQ